jgi:hypothetical protein
MSKTDELLQEILINQKKISKDIAEQKTLIENIEQRLNKIENETPFISKESEIPTALIRVLKALSTEDRPISAQETSKRVNLSRNLTSGYLNRLSDLGYTKKERNIDGKGSRYLFRTNYASIPQDIRQMLKKYEAK